ncbi:MAG: hypothetical protein P8Z79_22590 [Sedimentisphaerales bacterium]|jgi:hypothetical protein
MRRYIQSTNLGIFISLIIALGLCETDVCGQYLRAYLGVGYPDVTDGVFEGTTDDIVNLTGEWGNFLLLDFVSSDPTLGINQFTLDLSASADATIESVYETGHNPDGATFVSVNLVDDRYTASFTGFTDSVDVLFIHFNFDKVSYGSGTPLGKDYVGATISATLSDETVISGTFDVVDYFTAIAQFGVAGGGPIDIWIRDCDADIGDVPSDSVCPQWYTSPDIFIDNNYNRILDAPVIGVDNILRGVVRNRGTGFAENVAVTFYYRNNTTGLVFPDGATMIGSKSVNIPPNGRALTSVVWHNLPAPPDQGHWCIGAVLGHPADPAISPAVIPYQDNNVGCANIWYIAGRAGEELEISFSASTGGESGFGMTVWPREFILDVAGTLPVGWTVTTEDFEPDRPFALKLGQERQFKLNVFLSDKAKPHTGGTLQIEQIDVSTGRVVGGVCYNVYEDHFPPKRIGNIDALIGNDTVILTWEPVLIEQSTGLEEKVAYYEILRDGEVVTKVVRDEDPTRYGMQWNDFDFKGLGRQTYSVRAVDDAGNVSRDSATVTVDVSSDGVRIN